ncbi:hypothetical protein GIB67_007742 [Kingdonia uniflora]|uniref:Uncharacterized protein n=1 Tax=Kingdonia uniflora TaxID=39325 RepID=A0A7J7N1N3_9MAGN|nr:hypothetical protein GIB67_007742 [Kingdonia uniflora]
MKMEEGSLRSLRDLFMLECQNLKMLPDGLQYITTLGKLFLKNMPKEFNGRVEKAEKIGRKLHMYLLSLPGKSCGVW